jgi:hypothetical protein
VRVALLLAAVTMETEGGGPIGPSYSVVTAKEQGSTHFKWSTFELPAGMQQIIWKGRDA